MTAGKTAIYLFKYTTINIGNEVLSRITLNTRFATARLQVMTSGERPAPREKVDWVTQASWRSPMIKLQIQEVDRALLRTWGSYQESIGCMSGHQYGSIPYFSTR